MGTMKIFIARGEYHIVLHDAAFTVYCIGAPEPNTFITRKHDSLARFIYIVTPLANVYSLPMTALHIFYDLSGGLIAFNRNGSLFLNYRFFEAWRACLYLELHAFLMTSTVDDQDVKNGVINQAYTSW